MSFNEARKIAEAIEEMRYSIDQMVAEMGSIALNHFKKSFTDQGFTDDIFSPWKRRKFKDSRRGRITRAEKRWGDEKVRSVKNRGILIKTGELKRSLVAKRRGNYDIVISSNKDYANIHNEGLTGKAWGKHSFKMTKRQFVGYSGVLNRRLVKKFDSRIKRIFK